MAIPAGILSSEGGRPLTSADIRREWWTHAPTGPDDRPATHQVMEKLGLLPSSWTQLLTTGFPASGTVAEQWAWMEANGWV